MAAIGRSKQAGVSIGERINTSICVLVGKTLQNTFSVGFHLFHLSRKLLVLKSLNYEALKDQ